MVKKSFIPDFIPERGDVVWISFDPQTGKEIKKRRPALILSNYEYNKVVGLCVVCPITSKIKGYGFEVVLKQKEIEGAILADHIKSQDFKTRGVEFICKVSPEVLEEVMLAISDLIG